jgi:hypothetical protein
MSKVAAGIAMFVVNFVFALVLGYVLVSLIPCNAAQLELGCGLQALLAPVILAGIYSIALWLLQTVLRYVRTRNGFIKASQLSALFLLPMLTVWISFLWLNYQNSFALLAASFLMFFWSVIVVTVKYGNRPVQGEKAKNAL